MGQKQLNKISTIFEFFNVKFVWCICIKLLHLKHSSVSVFQENFGIQFDHYSFMNLIVQIACHLRVKTYV